LTRKEGRRRYLWSIIACAATLLSKSSWVVLPILLVVYQWMIEGERNWKKLLLDKLPYFALVFLAGLATLYSQKLNPEIYKFAGEGPLETALAEAVVWARYVRMTLWPVGLSVSYEVKKWGVAPVSIIAALSLIALIAATVIYSPGASDKKARSWSPLRMGILWFFIALLPVSNIIPLPVALKNRYLYLPLIGVTALMAQLWVATFNSKVRLGRTTAVAIILCLMAITAQRSYQWGRFSIRIKPGCRGTACRAPTALSAYPDDPHLLTTCGCALLQLGKMGNAERALQMAVRQNSRDGMTYVCLSIIASTRGEKYETVKLLERAVEVDPENAHANLKLAVMLEQSAPEKALYHFQKVLEIEPDHPDRERIKAAIKRLKQ